MTRSTLSRGRAVLAFTVLLAIVGALVWLSNSTYDAPATQPPLTRLDPASLQTLQADFNRAAGEHRMIVLLSPT